MKVKRYFAAEHTTTWSKATGLLPNRECEHSHRTEEAAEKCAAKNYPWKVYAELSDGRVISLRDWCFAYRDAIERNLSRRQ